MARRRTKPTPIVAPHFTACDQTAGELVAGQALGRTATGIRAVNGVWEIEWHTRWRPTTREEKARFVWDSLSAVVAGPVGVLLGVEVSRHGRPLTPAERVERLAAERRAAEASMPLPFRTPVRVTTGVILDGDPESVLLAWSNLVSAGVWRGGGGVFQAPAAVREAGHLLAFPPATVAAVGAGPPAQWLHSPHGPVIGLVRRAEDRAETLLRDRLLAVLRVAEALSAARPRERVFGRVQPLLEGS